MPQIQFNFVYAWNWDFEVRMEFRGYGRVGCWRRRTVLTVIQATTNILQFGDLDSVTTPPQIGVGQNTQKNGIVGDLIIIECWVAV